MLLRHRERSEVVQGRTIGLLRCAYNDDKKGIISIESVKISFTSARPE